MTYRDRSQTDAAPTNASDDWQDWPPESSRGESGSDATLWLAKWANEPVAKGSRPIESPGRRGGA